MKKHKKKILSKLSSMNFLISASGLLGVLLCCFSEDVVKLLFYLGFAKDKKYQLIEELAFLGVILIFLSFTFLVLHKLWLTKTGQNKKWIRKKKN